MFLFLFFYMNIVYIKTTSVIRIAFPVRTKGMSSLKAFYGFLAEVVDLYEFSCFSNVSRHISDAAVRVVNLLTQFVVKANFVNENNTTSAMYQAG